MMGWLFLWSPFVKYFHHPLIHPHAVHVFEENMSECEISSGRSVKLQS